jgi:predicted transcriptional regulator
MPARGKKKTRVPLKELLILLLLRMEGPVGRYALKDMAGMADHEGIVRLMLTELKERGYVTPTRQGNRLTDQGERFLESRLKAHDIVAIRELHVPFLMSGPAAVGIHLRTSSEPIPTSGIEMRDAAVRAGANGSTLLVLEDGVLTVPNVYSDLAVVHEGTSRYLMDAFDLSDNDVLIVISARDKWQAYEGAIATAMIGSRPS